MTYLEAATEGIFVISCVWAHCLLIVHEKTAARGALAFLTFSLAPFRNRRSCTEEASNRQVFSNATGARPSEQGTHILASEFLSSHPSVVHVHQVPKNLALGAVRRLNTTDELHATRGCQNELGKRDSLLGSALRLDFGLTSSVAAALATTCCWSRPCGASERKSSRMISLSMPPTRLRRKGQAPLCVSLNL